MNKGGPLTKVYVDSHSLGQLALASKRIILVSKTWQVCQGLYAALASAAAGCAVCSNRCLRLSLV